MYCSNCGGKNENNARFCSACGKDITVIPLGEVEVVSHNFRFRDINYRREREVGILLALGIFFLPVFFVWFTLRDGHSSISRMVSFSWLLLLVIIKLDQSEMRFDHYKWFSRTPAPAPRLSALSRYEFLRESCTHLSEKFNIDQEFSELEEEEFRAEREKLLETYNGKIFQWRLRATDVIAEDPGGFIVQYRCAKRPQQSDYDVQIRYTEDEKSYVDRVYEGSLYQVTAQLNTDIDPLRMSADHLP